MTPQSGMHCEVSGLQILLRTHSQPERQQPDWERSSALHVRVFGKLIHGWFGRRCPAEMLPLRLHCVLYPMTVSIQHGDVDANTLKAGLSTALLVMQTQAEYGLAGIGQHTCACVHSKSTHNYSMYSQVKLKGPEILQLKPLPIERERASSMLWHEHRHGPTGQAIAPTALLLVLMHFVSLSLQDHVRKGAASLTCWSLNGAAGTPALHYRRS